MKRIALVIALVMLLTAPAAYAVTWQDINGNNDFDCATTGFFIIEGTGKVQVTLTSTATNKFAGIIVYEKFVSTGYERTGNIKLDDTLAVTYEYPGVFKRIGLKEIDSSGTATIDGHSRMLIYGRREGIQLKGNYSYINYFSNPACTVATDQLPE